LRDSAGIKPDFAEIHVTPGIRRAADPTASPPGRASSPRGTGSWRSGLSRKS